MMIRSVLAASIISGVFGQLSPAGTACPQRCPVGQTGPQFSTSVYQSPILYKNVPYQAVISPYNSVQLIDSTGNSTIFQYNGWIGNATDLFGQMYVSGTSSSASYNQLTISYICDTTLKPLTLINDGCISSYFYVNPEFCRINFKGNFTCSNSQLPSVTPTSTAKAADSSSASIVPAPSPSTDITTSSTAVPTKRIEPSSSSTVAPTNRIEPSSSSGSDSTPSYTSAPTKRIEPSLSSTVTSVKSEPSVTAASTVKSEPSFTAASTVNSEPSLTAASVTSASTVRPLPSDPTSEPIPSNPTEPSYTPHPNICDGLCIINSVNTIPPSLPTNVYRATQFNFYDGTINNYELQWSQYIKIDQALFYRFNGWIIDDNRFVGQQFTSENDTIFIGFDCANDVTFSQSFEGSVSSDTATSQQLATIIEISTSCGAYKMIYHTDFCNLQTNTTETCQAAQMTAWPTIKALPSIIPIPSEYPPMATADPTARPQPISNRTCDDMEVNLCIRRDVISPSINITSPVITRAFTREINNDIFEIDISSKLVIKSNISREFVFAGWVIVDEMFVGQKFINSVGMPKFVQFMCSERNFIGIVHIDDVCVPRLGLLHPAFCTNMTTDIQCAHTDDSAGSNLQPIMTQIPTRRPEFSELPTRRPTLSALPTRRPTISAMPTRIFRSPPPPELAKTLRSQIRIETRNESLFENPKNVEAVVKTVVCALNVKPETVAVTGIQHFIDNVLMSTIPVPQINRQRNFTNECALEMPTRNQSSVNRMLQGGLDTYVVQYEVQNPPQEVTALEPATVASLIQTAPTLVSSLDIPSGSYVAITADTPSYLSNSEQANTAASNTLTNNILMGVFIPVGIAAIGAIVAMTMKKRSNNSPATNFNNVTTMSILKDVPAEFTQTNPATQTIKMVRVQSKISMIPTVARR